MNVAAKNNSPIRTLTYSAICLALCLVLPFLTGQIPQIGSALCPMHLPVLLCGFLCGPWWAAAVGFVAPLLRSAIFTMPPMPAAIAMAFELCTYGLISGLLRRKSRESLGWLYGSLILAMIAGRLVWGAAQVVILGLGDTPFTWAAFWAGAVANAIPGIIVQLILIPLLVVALRKAKLAD
ncbi:MAG: ECF transporter S component [Ruminococcaceae bacterium]|nr:ECF transporter S component [Oscillospiraceae bacterium]